MQATDRERQDTGLRMVDRNGMRAGATISAVALLAAFLTDWQYIAPVMGAVMAIGVVFGLRYSPLGGTYRLFKRAFRLDIPKDPEEEAPPRFAQAMGFAFMLLAGIGFFVLDSALFGWTWALIMVAAQLLLGIGGICLGCEVYLLGRRLRRRVAAA